MKSLTHRHVQNQSDTEGCRSPSLGLVGWKESKASFLTIQDYVAHASASGDIGVLPGACRAREGEFSLSGPGRPSSPSSGSQRQPQCGPVFTLLPQAALGPSLL